MGFDLEQYRAAQRPWTFTTNGRTYVAHPISAPRVVRYLLACEGASEARTLRETEDLLREAFPRRFSMRWRGDPVRIIMDAEPSARNAALLDFFGWADVPVPSRPLMMMSGTNWPH